MAIFFARSLQLFYPEWNLAGEYRSGVYSAMKSRYVRVRGSEYIGLIKPTVFVDFVDPSFRDMANQVEMFLIKSSDESV